MVNTLSATTSDRDPVSGIVESQIRWDRADSIMQCNAVKSQGKYDGAELKIKPRYLSGVRK